MKVAIVNGIGYGLVMLVLLTLIGVPVADALTIVAFAGTAYGCGYYSAKSGH